MRGNNVLGIIFSDMSDTLSNGLTSMRTMGSVPFGGRYRMIDFPLSNMSSSGINKVGVITKGNYKSLMDHVGSGKPWDLSKRNGGLFLLPPFVSSYGDFTSRIEALYAVIDFLKSSHEEYVIMSDCDCVCSLNYNSALTKHIKNKADITILYKRDIISKDYKDAMVLSMDEKEKVSDILINPEAENEVCYSVNMFIISRELLISLVSECVSRNALNFRRDILQKNVKRLNIYGHRIKTFIKMVYSERSYFDLNMELISPEAREGLFKPGRPIYTKVRDDMPSRYGKNCEVKNSLVSNGCVIEGKVEGSVLFKGVHIGEGTKVTNSVIMQDTVIGSGCDINCVIVDKDVVIKDNRKLMGFKSYPVYIGKSSIV